MELKPYSKYKPSGVEWLGDVPEYWKVKKIKWETPVLRGASPRPIEDPAYFDDDGEYSWVRICDVTASKVYLERTEQRLSESGSSLSVKLNPGAIFLSIAATVGVPCITKIKCCIHDGFVYFPRLKTNTKYLYYMFDSGEPYKGLGKLGTQLNLNTDTVGSIAIGFPSVSEQHAIIEYLDRETSRIDELIAKKERLIELLKEKRVALIFRAATKGLNPNVRLKPSGVEWLGDVPEHWEVKQLKYLARLETGNTPSKNDDDNYSDDGSLWVKPDNLSKFIPIRETKEYLSEKGIALARLVPAFSPLVCCIGTIGKFGYSEHQIATNQQINAVIYSNKIFNRYGLYLVAVSSGEYLRNTNINVVAILNADNQRQIIYPLPPYSEQQAIAEYLDRETGKIDALIEKVQIAIEKLKEYRIAIISATVTGKIDVRK